MQSRGYTILAYVDDFCGVGITEQSAKSSFNEFHELTTDLGLKLAPDKTIPPGTSMEWLGFLFDSHDMTITIPQVKLDELLKEARRGRTEIEQRDNKSSHSRAASTTSAYASGRRVSLWPGS